MSGRESRAERIFVDWLESMVDGAPRIPFEDLAAEHRADADELRELHRDWLAFAPLLGEAVPGSVDGALPSLGPSGALPDESFEELFGFDLPESGRYRFRSLLGRGGGGVVLKVWDAKLDRALAMKVVLGRGESFPNADASSIDPQLVSRFVDEARIASQLDHPSIVPVHELGRDQGGRAFFTMRLVQGEDLGLIFARCWRGDPDWTLARIVGVLVRVSEALAFAHERGVLHRDLKPANVMVGQHGVVHVMDWGLARSASAGATEGDVRTVRGVQRAAAPDSPLLTGAGAALGTPAYMAPEQARGDHAAVDARTDVYAIGAMLYELLAQRSPYVGADEQPSAFEVIDRIQAGPPESLERVASVAPIELVAIAERAMAREPDARYAGMADLQADLRAVTEGRVVRALESGALAEARKWVRRNPALAGALAGVVVVASLGAGISLVQARAAERARLQAERSAIEAREGQ